MSEIAISATAPAARTRPFLWSLRREIWENRSLYLAPIGVAAFAVLALVIHAVTMPSHLPGMLAVGDETAGSASYTYRVVTMLVLMTALVVGAFYCLDALSSERRDRSILFWKSLPVSDRTTVLAKATVPMAVLPVLSFAAIVVATLTMLVLSVIVVVASGQSVTALMREISLLELWGSLAYSLVVIALWHAPLYALLLLVSSWSRRIAAVWAFLPFLVVGALEKLTLDTTNVLGFVQHRVLGWYPESFVVSSHMEAIPFSHVNDMSPGRFLATPGLWLGLLAAALFLAGAVRLRRSRDPG